MVPFHSFALLPLPEIRHLKCTRSTTEVTPLPDAITSASLIISTCTPPSFLPPPFARFRELLSNFTPAVAESHFLLLYALDDYRTILTSEKIKIKIT